MTRTTAIWERLVEFAERCHRYCLLVCIAEGIVFTLILAVLV